MINWNIVLINGTIETQCYHLRNLSDFQISRNLCAVSGTKTIRQDTFGLVTFWRSIGIFINGTSGFIRTVGTVNKKNRFDGKNNNRYCKQIVDQFFFLTNPVWYHRKESCQYILHCHIEVGRLDRLVLRFLN